MYQINYKNGSVEIEKFDSIKEFGIWWRVMVKLGNRKRNGVISVKKVN